jgi:hypothetical protein
MKQTILILLLLTSIAAMGQSLEDEKACQVQAQKVGSKDAGVRVSSHYDANTKTCWVKEFQSPNGATHETIFDAHKLSSESEFSSIPATKSILCWVRDTKCKSFAEFEKLVKQQYGF